MSKKTKRGKYELHDYVSDSKRKFMGLTNPSHEDLIEKLKAIDWSKEKRSFIDLGESFAYNPHSDFHAKRMAFLEADATVAPLLLATLCQQAYESGIPEPEVRAWAKQQMDRWHKERRWERMN